MTKLLFRILLRSCALKAPRSKYGTENGTKYGMIRSAKYKILWHIQTGCFYSARPHCKHLVQNTVQKMVQNIVRSTTYGYIYTESFTPLVHTESSLSKSDVTPLVASWVTGIVPGRSPLSMVGALVCDHGRYHHSATPIVDILLGNVHVMLMLVMEVEPVFLVSGG